MKKEPGFSTEKERLLKEGTVEEVTSESDALSLSSPAFAVIAAVAPVLSP